MKKLIIIVCLILLLAGGAWATDYTVPTSTTTVDGSTFCGGSACTSSDTIIIAGGARGDLYFQNFDGAGSYIIIKNDPASRVVLTGNNSTTGALQINGCKWVDLRGDNLPGTTYGIKVTATVNGGNGIRIKGQSDHIKVSYCEVTATNAEANGGSGIFLQDGSLSNAWTWDTIEIHHNYVHDTNYAGMYLGQNAPWSNDDPYIANLSVHDNQIIDIGCYGIAYKGITDSTANYIYNNTIKNTGLANRPDLDDGFRHGMSVHDFWGASSVEVYDNWIEKTVGPGIEVQNIYSSITPAEQIHDNTIVGCGQSTTPKYNDGISFLTGSKNVDVYDNIIIQPGSYGFYTVSDDTVTPLITLERNKVGDAGAGALLGGDHATTNFQEGTGADANIYHADVADFGFCAWSDDGDYSNDDFSTTGCITNPPFAGSGGGLFTIGGVPAIGTN